MFVLLVWGNLKVKIPKEMANPLPPMEICRDYGGQRRPPLCFIYTPMHSSRLMLFLIFNSKTHSISLNKETCWENSDEFLSHRPSSVINLSFDNLHFSKNVSSRQWTDLKWSANFWVDKSHWSINIIISFALHKMRLDYLRTETNDAANNHEDY